MNPQTVTAPSTQPQTAPTPAGPLVGSLLTRFGRGGWGIAGGMLAATIGVVGVIVSVICRRRAPASPRIRRSEH